MKIKKLMSVIFSGELAAAEKAVADAIFGKLAKDGRINQIRMHVKSHDVSGGGDARTKSCVVLHAKTDFGFLVSEGIGWQFNLALSDAVRRLEEQLHRKISKSEERRRIGKQRKMK